MPSEIIERLFKTIQSRKGADPETSYTAKLFHRGRERIAQKVGEEAVETVIAAINRDNEHIVSESADLLYHLCVLWADAGLSPEDIWTTLEKREGISGIAEKNSRKKE